MENIGQLIKQISNRLIRDLNKNLKQFDITFSQLQVLVVIQASNGAICQKEIANTLKIKHTSLIDILKVLERKELIIRSTSEENAKFREVSLTSKSRDILKQMDFGKYKTQEMIANTLGFSSVEDMINKFKLVLNKLESGDY